MYIEEIIHVKYKIAIVTGGCHGIGESIVKSFTDARANVYMIDIKENGYFTGNISDKITIENFVDKVVSEHKKIDFLINNAPRDARD